MSDTARRDQSLVAELERQSGVCFKTRADVGAYLARQQPGPDTEKPQSHAWSALRRALLAFGLTLAFLQYYLIDVYVQIASLPSIALVALR